MYKTFYSLSREPFPKDLNPDQAFQSSAHQGAARMLEHLRNAKGIGLLTGESGTGKSLALRTFSSKLHPGLYHCFYFPMSTGNVMDFYRAIAYGLGEEPKFRKVDLFRQIQEAILRLSKERKITPVIILDEMHFAKDAFLQDLVLLFNFEMDSSNPFIVMMAGLPHLKQRIERYAHESLRQRIIAHYEMKEMTIEESKSYIHHHLSLAGLKQPVFTEGALNAIAARVQGCARTIGHLTNTCLSFGEKEQRSQIDEEIVQKAAEGSLL
jgi:type II secretory pathway predicted ATPase ExeA